LAERLSGPGSKRGQEVYFRCPLHDDHNPSLRINLERDKWYCDPFSVGGDVVELARLAWGYSKDEVKMAAADLLGEFGYEIPTRPPSWYAKQERQRPVRDALMEAKIRHVQRRVFRIFMPMIEEIEDEDERREEVEYLWDAAEAIAVCVVAGSST